MDAWQKENTIRERWRLMGIVVWVSFVSAGVATGLFFATFDPLDIIGKTTFPLDWTRTQCYSIGFFLFWALTAATGATVAWLVVTPVTSAHADKHCKGGK